MSAIKYSYWGPVQQSETIAEGIIWVSTAGHGGYVLSPERLAEMPAHYRACSFSKDHNFEEDCSWCAVALTWPQYFDAKTLEAAQATYDMFYAPKKEQA